MTCSKSHGTTSRCLVSWCKPNKQILIKFVASVVSSLSGLAEQCFRVTKCMSVLHHASLTGIRRSPSLTVLRVAWLVSSCGFRSKSPQRKTWANMPSSSTTERAASGGPWISLVKVRLPEPLWLHTCSVSVQFARFQYVYMMCKLWFCFVGIITSHRPFLYELDFLHVAFCNYCTSCNTNKCFGP